MSETNWLNITTIRQPGYEVQINRETLLMRHRRVGGDGDTASEWIAFDVPTNEKRARPGRSQSGRLQV